MYENVSFLLVSGGALALANIAGRGGRPWLPATLLLMGVALRIFGSTARYELIFRFYGGLGDAVAYYYEGLNYAQQIWSQPFLPFSVSYWTSRGTWWGTSFLEHVSGIVIAVIGPSLRAEFVVFSMLALVGLALIAQAFAATQPDPACRLRFSTWLLLWPSLWFWPSSVGKEGILMLAIGLATVGYAGRAGRIRWVLLLSGIALAFALRPHVALVLAIATLAANWLESWGGRIGMRQLIEAVVAIALTVIALNGMREQFGLQEADLEGVVEFVEYRAGQTLQGGSNIGAVPVGPQGVPLAIINVWMRPFPWEVHNMTSAIAAAELVLFWYLVWQRRREVRLAFQRWRRHRLIRFAIPMLITYTIMIGMTFGNLGLIARQRVLVFPFMLLIVAAAPALQRRVGAKAEVSVPVRSERRAA